MAKDKIDRDNLFVERWRQQRKAGVLYSMLIIGSCTFILLLFAQLIYQMIIKDFSSFHIHPLYVVISLAAGLLYWFVKERRFKKLCPEAANKRSNK